MFVLFLISSYINAVSVTIIACSFACFLVLQMLRGSQFLIHCYFHYSAYIEPCLHRRKYHDVYHDFMFCDTALILKTLISL